jgi:branched-chain amino acid transport system substrate-binding protein
MVRLVVAISFLAVLVFAPPALAAGTVPGVTDTEVVIGATTPLSGPAAVWGTTSLGAEAWAKHVNAQGGVHGRKIRFVLKDDGYAPARAVANVNELKDSVFALVGLLGTAICNASKDVVAESNLPTIYPYCNPLIFAKQPKEKIRNVFQAYPVYVDEAEFLVQQAAKLVKAKKVALFYQNDDYGQTGLEGLRRGLKGLEGVALAGAVPYEVADREMGTHALKVKETGADALILYATPTHASALIKEMARVGYRPKIFAAFPLGDRHTMFRLLGDLWEGAYYDVNGAVPGEPDADRVVALLLKQNPELKGRESFAILGATAMMVTVEALQRAGRDLTREKFIAAMESFKDWTPEKLTAPITWAPGRHHGLNTVRLMQAKSAADASFTPMTGYQPFPSHF